KRGRGRPRKSGRDGAAGTPETTPSRPLDVDGITAILLSIHGLLSSFTKIPELEIEETEAKKIGEALKRVADQYDTVVSEKTLAWTNLVSSLSIVYGTRIFAYRARVRTDMDEKISPKTPLRTVS